MTERTINLFIQSLLLASLTPVAVAQDAPGDLREKWADRVETELGIKPEIQEDAIASFEEQLAEIVLPAQPTREQCADYLGQMRMVAKQYRVLTNGTTRDGRILSKKIANEFPAEHVDQLVIEVASGTRLDGAAIKAIKALDPDPAELRKRVVAQLEQHPPLIRAVLANGWCEAARPIIIKAVLSEEPLPTRDWFIAAVELKEPDLYRQLHERTIRSEYAVDYLDALSALPDYDQRNTIRTVIKRFEKRELKLSFEGGYNATRQRLRVLSAQQGDIDALGALINEMTKYGLEFGADYENYFTSDRLAVIKLIDFKGSDQEIEAWFKDNRENLAFDQFRNRFVIQNDGR